MRRSSPTALVLASGLAAWLATGCGGGKTIDAPKAQDYIKANLVKQGVPNPSVSCPPGVAVHKDKVFDCAATSAGQKVTFTLRILDDSGKVDVVSFRQG